MMASRPVSASVSPSWLEAHATLRGRSATVTRTGMNATAKGAGGQHLGPQGALGSKEEPLSQVTVELTWFKCRHPSFGGFAKGNEGRRKAGIDAIWHCRPREAMWLNFVRRRVGPRGI